MTLQGGAAEANIPNWQLGLYIQDDWRLNDRLTLNLGFRYDYLDGWAIDQTKNANFGTLQDCRRRGPLRGSAGFREFGLDSKEDTNNWQGRAGLAWDVRGDGRDLRPRRLRPLLRRGLHEREHPVPGDQRDGHRRRHGLHRDATPAGIRKADGTFFRVGDPISTIQSQNEAGGALPLNSHIASPRIRQPYTDQYSVGWSHQLDAATVIDIDYMHSEGRDLGWRIQLNHRNPGVGATGPRQFADLPISPANFTIDVSDGKSKYDGINFGVRRRMMQRPAVHGVVLALVGEVHDGQRVRTSSTCRTSRTTWIRTRTCSSVRRAAPTRVTARRCRPCGRARGASPCRRSGVTARPCRST